ncbi:MAG TPA: aspartate 1-decarboxylase [Alphaproteobacteria bacterium]|nr:aspartate 1-decarboxylase [Rhodospirillaceae bacterium]HRJ12164.1 aspartate 1-decarboxylase [Alphaproteobacteria bacterium]
MQLVNLLKCKLHHARITHCQREYRGSIGISRDLMDAIGLLENEVVHVWAVDHEARIITYAIPMAEKGVIQLKGGAANHFNVGDRVVIAAFIHTDEPLEPRAIMLDAENNIIG